MEKVVDKEVINNSIAEEIHATLDSFKNNYGDPYFIENVYLNNDFVKSIKYLFNTNQLTLIEMEECTDILGLGIEVKQNSLMKNNNELVSLFDKEQIKLFDIRAAIVLINELALYLNKSIKMQLVKKH